MALKLLKQPDAGIRGRRGQRGDAAGRRRACPAPTRCSAGDGARVTSRRPPVIHLLPLVQLRAGAVETVVDDDLDLHRLVAVVADIGPGAAEADGAPTRPSPTQAPAVHTAATTLPVRTFRRVVPLMLVPSMGMAGRESQYSISDPFRVGRNAMQCGVVRASPTSWRLGVNLSCRPVNPRCSSVNLRRTRGIRRISFVPLAMCRPASRFRGPAMIRRLRHCPVDVVRQRRPADR
jgi:hypothetical protein